MERRQLYVPVVSYPPDARGSVALCSLWCEPAGSGEPPRDVPSDADKRLAPVAARLLSANLFQSGCTAAMAVRKLGLRLGRLAFWQRLRPYAWLESRRLCAGDSIPAVGSSAELGLALALLLPHARYQGPVFASGSLSGDSPELRERDTAVGTVGGLEQKLGEVLRRAEGLLAGVRGPALCFTPLRDEEGRPVAELTPAARLRELGVEVVPVAWLSEAVARLGCGRVPLLAADRLALAAGLALILGLGAGGAARLWRDFPIPLAFERGGGEAVAREPYLACGSRDGRHLLPHPIVRRDQIPRLPPGQHLAWSVSVGAADAWDARVMAALGSRGYYLLFAVLAADGSSILIHQAPADGRQGTSAPYRAVPGTLWEQWFQIPRDLAPGETLLLILARRDRGFDPEALGQALRSGSGPRGGTDWLNQAVHLLQAQAPGSLVYQFDRSGDVPDPCAS